MPPLGINISSYFVSTSPTNGYSLFFSVQLLKSMAIGHFGGIIIMYTYVVLERSLFLGPTLFFSQWILGLKPSSGLEPGQGTVALYWGDCLLP